MNTTNKSLRQIIAQLVKLTNCKDCNGGGGIGQETDPIFNASPAATITQADIDLWNSGGGDFVPMNGMDLLAGQRMKESFLLSNYDILTEVPPDNSISVGMSQLLGGFVYSGTALNAGTKYTGSLNAGPTGISTTSQSDDGNGTTGVSSIGTNPTNNFILNTGSNGDFTGTAQFSSSVNPSGNTSRISVFSQGINNTVSFQNEFIVDESGYALINLQDNNTVNDYIVADVAGRLYKRTLPPKADLVGGVVPASQLPSYVDDVLEFANLASFPTTGEQGKLYVALDTNKIYRWSGSVYVDMTPGEADTLNTVVNRGAYSSKPISFLSSSTTPATGDPIGAIGIQSSTYSYYWGDFSQSNTGLYNVSISYGALQKSTSGSYNIGIGVFAGKEITTGKTNTLIGSLAGQKTTTGNYNIMLGNQTGNENTTGYKNTYIGTYAGYNNATSNMNVMIGYKAGNQTAMGDRNLFLGSFSGQGVSGQNNLILGIGGGYKDGAISNKLIIHNNNTLSGYGPLDTQEGTLGSPQQGQLSRALVTGDFVDRWFRINGYIVTGSPGNNTADISLIPGQGIKSTVYYAPTLATDYVQKQYVDTIKPYKSYVCLIQAGGTPTPSPSFVELENTIGAIVWTRNDVGEYFGTLTGAFPSNKVVCFAQLGLGNSGAGPNKNIITARLDNDRVFLKVTNEDGSATPFEFSGQIGSLEIRVYN